MINPWTVTGDWTPCLGCHVCGGIAHIPVLGGNHLEWLCMDCAKLHEEGWLDLVILAKEVSSD